MLVHFALAGNEFSPGISRKGNASLNGERLVELVKALEERAKEVDRILSIVRPRCLADGVHGEHRPADVDRPKAKLR